MDSKSLSLTAIILAFLCYIQCYAEQSIWRPIVQPVERRYGSPGVSTRYTDVKSTNNNYPSHNDDIITAPVKSSYDNYGVSPNNGNSNHFSFTVNSEYRTATSDFNLNPRENNYQTKGHEFSNPANRQISVHQQSSPYRVQSNFNSYSSTQASVSNGPQFEPYSRTNTNHVNKMQQYGNGDRYSRPQSPASHSVASFNSQIRDGYGLGSTSEQENNRYNAATAYATMGVSSYRSTANINQDINQIRNSAIKYFSGQTVYDSNHHSYGEFRYGNSGSGPTNSEPYNTNLNMKASIVGNTLGTNYNRNNNYNMNSGYGHDDYSINSGQKSGNSGYNEFSYNDHVNKDQSQFKGPINNNYGYESPNKMNSHQNTHRPDYPSTNKHNLNNNYLNGHRNSYGMQSQAAQLQRPQPSPDFVTQSSPQMARLLPSPNLGGISSSGHSLLARPQHHTKPNHQSSFGLPPSLSLTHASPAISQVPPTHSSGRPSEEHNRGATPSVNLPSSQHFPLKMPAQFYSHSSQSVPPEQQIQQLQQKHLPPPRPLALQPVTHNPNTNVQTFKGTSGFLGRDTQSHNPNAIDDGFFQRLSKLMDVTLFYGDLDFKKHF